MSRGRRGGERSTTGLSLGPDSALQSCFLHPSGTGDEGGIFCAGGRSEGGPWDQSEEGSVPGRVVQGQQSQVLQAGLSPEGRRSRPAPVPLVRWVVVPAPPGPGRGPPFQEKNVLQRRRVPMVSPRWRGGQGQLGTGASCGASGCQLGAGSALRTCGNQDGVVGWRFSPNFIPKPPPPRSQPQGLLLSRRRGSQLLASFPKRPFPHPRTQHPEGPRHPEGPQHPEGSLCPFTKHLQSRKRRRFCAEPPESR